MPLSRYLVRNEYGLADPELYRAADKDDPEALLEGVAMAGLVGVLRQLGDLAEFAAEMFHDLHEEVLATAARGHALIARVQQLEAEFPSAEKTLLSQTSHIPFLYRSGVDWHPTIRMDENLVTQGDMPRFVMDSYEECRGPPRLFLLDKFDVAGAGACLKRYTDPSFFKAESADFSIKKSEGQREKRIRKVKRRGSQWRNGDTPEVFPSSHAKLHQLLLEERIETGANDPERRVKLKKRQLDGFKREDKLKSYMQKLMDTYSSDNKVVHEISLDLVPMNFESTNDTCEPGLEIVEIDTVSPSREPFYRDKAAYSSCDIPEGVKPLVSQLNEVTDGRAVEIPGTNYEAHADNLSLFDKDVTNEELATDTGSKSGGSVGESNIDDIASEIENYVDALATMESESETDSDYRTKGDRKYLNDVKKMVDSDGSEEKQQQRMLFDYHSVGNSTISDDGSLLKKDIDSVSCSDNVSNFAEDATGEPTAKSLTAGPMNPLIDDEKSFTKEAQGIKTGEYIASDEGECMKKNPLVQSAKFKELPWISVNVGAVLTKKGNEGMEQTDLESKEQIVAHAVPNGDDHLTAVGVSPVDEMADASSNSSSDVSLGHSDTPEETSSHPQSEYDRDGESYSFIEMRSSSATPTAGNPIHDLRQPVEATSDGLTMTQKSFVSVLNYSEPVYAPCEDNDLSEDQPSLSGAVQDHEQPKGHVAGAPYVCMPNQLDLSEDALENSENETNMAADESESAEQMISVDTDVDGKVEPRFSTAANSEDSSAHVADGESPAMEIHHPLEPLCFEDSESMARLEFDSSENKVAHSVDESSGRTVCESTGAKKNMNEDDSSSLNLVVIHSQVHSQSDQVSKIPDALVLFDSQMDEAGGSASATIADIDDLSKSVSFDKVESHLSLEAISSHTGHLATYLDQPGPAPVSSSYARMVYDAIGPVEAEGDAISFDDITHGKDAAISSETISADSPSKHLPEGKNDLDLEHSSQVLAHSETTPSSVLDCSSTQYEESLSNGEDPYQNNEGSLIQSLQCQAEADLQNPVSCGRDDFVESDSTARDTSIVLRSTDNVPEICLSEGSQSSLYPAHPKEAPLSSVECVQHLPRINSSHYHIVEDQEHFVDAFDNVHANTQIALEKEIETQGIEMTVEFFNAVEGTSRPLEYVEKNLPPKDGGNEMCIYPISVSILCEPLSQPLVSDLSVHSGDYKVESQHVEGEPSTFSVSVSPPREPLVTEVPASSADHKLQSTWHAMEQSPADCSSTSGFPVEAQASLKIENPGQTMDLSQTNRPLFGRPPNPTHIKPGEMPPLPPLPPIQWRLGRNQHTSLASECLMQQPYGTRQRLDQPETSNNAGLRSQNYLGAQHLNPFFSLSGEGATYRHVTGQSGGYVQQPTGSVFSMPNMSHEDGQQYTIPLDQRQEAQLLTGSRDDLLGPASDTPMNKFSLEHIHSGLMAYDASSRTPELIQTETTVAHQQCELVFSPAEQETAVVDEHIEYKEEKEIATTSAQFEPSVAMQYGHQLSHGFMAPEGQGKWPTDVFGTVKPENVNGSLQKKIQRPRNPLIDAVVAVDKSKLRKIGEILKPQDQPETEKREQQLLQLRKVGERVRLQDAVKDEESFQNFPPLRKMGERIKPQDLPSAENSVQHLPQLRKVEERIIPQDEPKAEDEKQSVLPLKGVGGGLKPQDGPQPENKDWLEQIRNQSFNLKPATTMSTSRPNIQGRQTNLKVAAILEKANMIRQAIAGNDEDDSDGWSDS